MRRTLILLLLALLVPAVTAHAGEDQLNHTEELITAQTPCSELTEDELAAIGDYYMERMHPGEMHDLMDQHMGGQGSESLRQGHIGMADRFYCSQFREGDRGNWAWMPMNGGWGHGVMGGMWLGVLVWFGAIFLIALAAVYVVDRVRDRGSDRTREQDAEPAGTEQEADDEQE